MNKARYHIVIERLRDSFMDTVEVPERDRAPQFLTQGGK